MTPGGPDQRGGRAPEDWDAWLRSRLLEARQVVLRGPLDDATATRVAAELMYLDATGDEAVQLQLDSEGGPLQAAMALVDTIELLGVPVHATCVGRAEGSAVVVFAAAALRSSSVHARYRLHEPPTAASGTAGELAAWSEQRRREAARMAAVISDATGRPLEHVEADLATGRWLDADEARAYGLVHDIQRRLHRSDSALRPPRPFGFGPHEST